MAETIAGMKNPRFENLPEYVESRMVYQNAGWAGGKYYYEGGVYDAAEFEAMHPKVKLKKKTELLDGTQIET